MSREHRISWNAAQRARLNSAARKYNNAIRREFRKNPIAAEYLPAEVTYSELKASITTARALNNTVNRLMRATKPEALKPVQQADGSITTKYERREYAILRSVRERKKSIERKRAAAPNHPLAGVANAPDKRPIQGFSASQIRRFVETQSRLQNTAKFEIAQRYIENYMRALDSVFGGYAEYDDGIQAIKGQLGTVLNMQGLTPMQAMIDNAPSVNFVYGPLEREAKWVLIAEYFGI